jgi:hypothetical protein
MKLPEAEAEFRLALAVKRRLVADHTSVPKYRRNLGTGLSNLGLVL